jgi:glycosyltransferase involved in cell wall biosynthesis
VAGVRRDVNVAFVTNVVYPFVKGGAQKRVYELGRRLADRGHEVTVYARQFWEGPTAIEVEGMTYRGVAPARDLYTGSDSYGGTDGRRSISEAIGFAGKAVIPLARAVRRGDHDLAVASVFPYFPVLSARVATLFGNTPLVTTWHEVWGDYWEAYLGHLAPFGKVVERLVAAVAQHPVAVSRRTADQLATIGPARDAIRVVPNGVNVAAIREVSPADDGFDVLFAGRLIADKNVDALLSAFDGVSERHDATLGIVGDGPEFDALVQQARGLRHADRVTFLGFLEDYEDVLAQMHAASVFASPSTREGFGITLVEAMAADCTVVAVDHADSAASEVLGDGGFVTDLSVDGLADALDAALAGERPPQDPQRVAEQYDWDVLARRAERAYAAVAGERVPEDRQVPPTVE